MMEIKLLLLMIIMILFHIESNIEMPKYLMLVYILFAGVYVLHGNKPKSEE